MTSRSLISKFRGCMLGSIIGDCLGSPFEFDGRVSKRVLGNYMSNLLSGGSNQLLPYSDDTSMTFSVASSLVECKKVDAKDMAKKFVSEYFRQPKRGYGVNVMHVFEALRDSEFADVFLPAKLQFGGSGSYGNGAAMRIAPMALYAHEKDDEFLKNAVEECSRVTHTHPNGYNGAILQCFAVHAALKSDPSKELDPVEFITELENKMKSIETKTENTPFCDSLKKIKEIYEKKQENISSEEIAEYLGNEVAAHKSVPAAIYSFLRGMKPLPDFESLNPFVRTIHFAISLGGDSDTIASMAGSIAGAYYGQEEIPTELQERCEAIDKSSTLANELYSAFQK